MKINTSFWDQRRNFILSRKGGANFRTGVVMCHGYSMLEELVGNISYFQSLILNVTGRLVERRLADWIEASYICVSWPEPRIWCNHIGALGGTVRASAVAASMAGLLAADSRLYGSRPFLEGTRFIQKALLDKEAGLTVEEIVARECAYHRGKPKIVGYARPIARGDERVDALERVTEQFGFEIGKHLQLAYEIQDILIRDFDETMNIQAYINSFLSDHGFSPEELYHLATFSMVGGILASYIETSKNPPESFLPLRCDDIDYQGKAPRQVPMKENT